MGGSNRIIAKNTVYLYTRMIITFGVSLFTSRVILKELGIDDYGIFSVIISIIAIWTSLTGAIGQSTLRFITYQLGRVGSDGTEELKKCISTSKTIMLIMAGCVFVICQTLGLWLLYNQSGIPTNRIVASFWAYQLCVISSALTLIQIPYTSLIMAHERMNVYAYVSIVETVLKLLIVYLLVWSPFDKLVFYALLLLLVQIILTLFYKGFCYKSIDESKVGYRLHREYFNSIMSFSGWSIVNVSSTALLVQISNIVINNFFNPAIVAARTLGYQIKFHSSSFAKNFRSAANPQIIKRYSGGEIDGYKSLLFQSTNMSFYLMLVIVVPLLLETDKLLSIWLVTAPAYAVPFMRLALIEALFAVYDMSYYLIFESTGQLKENSILCTILDLVGFVAVVLCFVFGSSPLAISWCLIALTIIEGMVVKPLLAVKKYDFQIMDFIDIYKKGLLIAIASFLPSLVVKYLIGDGSVFSSLMIICFSFLICLAAVYLIGLDKQQKVIVKQFITNN